MEVVEKKLLVVNASDLEEVRNAIDDVSELMFNISAALQRAAADSLRPPIDTSGLLNALKYVVPPLCPIATCVREQCLFACREALPRRPHTFG